MTTSPVSSNYFDMSSALALTGIWWKTSSKKASSSSSLNAIRSFRLVRDCLSAFVRTSVVGGVGLFVLPLIVEIVSGVVIEPASG